MSLRLKEEIRKKHAFESVEQEAALNLFRTTDHLARGSEQVLKSAGISHTQYNVLRILRGAAGAGEHLSCREIATRMITRDPDMTRLLDRLESRGLISRSRSTIDRRVVYTRITEAGLLVLKQLDEPVRAMHRRQLGHMGEARLHELIRLLEAARAPVTEPDFAGGTVEASGPCRNAAGGSESAGRGTEP
jgi:DNA-binding MarR family transcriptional regulator